MLQRQPLDVPHSTVICQRCSAVLYRDIPHSIDNVIALSLAGLILFIVANVFPFLSFEVGSQSTHTTLFTGVRELYLQGIWALSGLILLTCILAPGLQLLLMLYLFLPLRFGRLARHTKLAFRSLRHIQTWNMIEVFMIGILVALVKLTKMADIVPGIAMWSFVVLIFVVTGASAFIDGRIIWRQLDSSQ